MTMLTKTRPVYKLEFIILLQKIHDFRSLKKKNDAKLTLPIKDEKKLPSKYLNKKFSSQQPDFHNPVILVWTTSPFIEEKGIEFQTKEQYGSCRITMDRSTLNKSIAVVIFNNQIKLDPLDIPDPKARLVSLLFISRSINIVWPVGHSNQIFNIFQIRFYKFCITIKLVI